MYVFIIIQQFFNTVLNRKKVKFIPNYFKILKFFENQIFSLITIPSSFLELYCIIIICLERDARTKVPLFRSTLT